MNKPAIHTVPFTTERWINRWDVILMPLVITVFFILAWAASKLATPYRFGETLPISLSPSALPGYAARTTLRMAIALACSLVFTFVYGNLAAKSRRAEKILVPLLDILQSVPILGFLSITVIWFIHLFPGSLAGAECAAIFAIFTSQAWNMTFSFYNSLRLLPKDLIHAADVYQLSAWQRFWKLEVPFAMPGLVWNTMMSVSGGWFFVVASEAITISGHTVMLPGVGSYIAVAIQHRDLAAIGYAIATMLVVILLYDQLIFRPLVAWAQKFKYEQTQGAEEVESWALNLIQRSHIVPRLVHLFSVAVRGLKHSRRVLPQTQLHRRFLDKTRRIYADGSYSDIFWNLLVAGGTVLAIILLARYVLAAVGIREVARVFMLGGFTLLRVVVLTLLASLLWVPIGVQIGLRPRLAERLQPAVLFLSAFPANLLFPVAVYFIVRHSLNTEIWLSPLMILGTQWYRLFNVIGGAQTISNDLREAAADLGLKGWILWKRLYLPAVFPAYLTGGLTASGGAWNASVVAEIVSWGPRTLSATGIGAYIAEQTSAGDHQRVALGIAVMSLYVLVFNRLVWKKLYAYAEERLALY